MIAISMSSLLCHSKVIWYVKSYNEQKCPNNSRCHTLSFYSRNTTLFFLSNTTFVFMEGEHKLEKNIVITEVSQIVFKSIVEYNYKDKDSSVINPTIKCSSANVGLQFINSSYVSLEALTINGCSSSRAGISFHNVSTVNIYQTTVQNTFGTGMLIDNSVFVTISKCYFNNNSLGLKHCSIEKSQLWHSVTITSNSLEEVHYIISDSVFVGNLPALGGGLYIYTTNIMYSEVTIKGCHFSNVVGCLDSAANVTIVNNSGNSIITILDSSFFKNQVIHTVHGKNILGGGLKVNLLQIANASQVSTRSSHISNIIIHNSTFSYNYAEFDAAGVGVEVNSSANPLRINVSNSTFAHNIAHNRGGGLYLFISDDIKRNKQKRFVRVVKCVFIDNQAFGDASGLMIWSWWSSNSQFYIIVSNCHFNSNGHDGYYQFAMVLRMFSYKKSIVSITVSNTSFVNNTGGSLYVSTLNGTKGVLAHRLNLLIYNCSFHNEINHKHASLETRLTSRYSSVNISHCTFNNGTSFWIASAMYIVSMNIDQALSSIHLSNVTVRHYKSGTSAILFISMYKHENVNIHNIQVLENNATGISCERCAFYFSGHSIIANNTSPYVGGGLVVNGSGYAVTRKNASVIFINNVATKGGALWSNAKNPSWTIFSSFHCTFIDFNVKFQNNSARITGDNIYGGLFHDCYGKKHKIGHIDFKDAIICTANKHVSQDYTSISSDPFGVCLCNQSNLIEYFANPNPITVYPGQSFNMSLITVGHCGSPSPGMLSISSSPNLRLISSINNDQTNTHCKLFVYKAIQLLLNASQGTATFSVSNNFYSFSKSLILKVQFLDCPSGMMLGPSYECVCNEIIVSYVECNVSWQPFPLLKSSDINVWLSFQEDYNCIIAYKNCPFDYCKSSEVHFNLDNETDLQCNHNRMGLLCGQCQFGLSLKLGSNECSKCTNIYLLLLIVFMFSGMLLVALLITLNLTVSVGTINGLLFYANIIKLNEAVFFPTGNIVIVSQFISWINLDFGIEVCLFDGLDGYWKTWLQFVFPFYVWTLVAGIIVISRRSTRLSQMFGRNIVPVLATLVLMSFTKMLRTTTNVLMPSKLHCGSYEWTVWSIDGNINYGTTKHSILIAFSVVVLVLSIIYSCLIFSTQWLQRYSHLCCRSRNDPVLKLLPFIDAYTGPYRERYQFWTGLLLIVRLLLTTIFINTSGPLPFINDYLIIVVEMIIVFILQHKVYRNRRLSFLEQSYHINLFILAVVNSFINQTTYKVYSPFVTVVSIGVAMVTIKVTILGHLYSKFKKMKCYKEREETQPLLNNVSHDYSQEVIYSPSVTIRRRESLIFDFAIDHTESS